MPNLLPEFPTIVDERGRLTFAQEGDHLPFPIKRMFWITDVPQGAERGGHAHTTCQEVVCCVSGSFLLTVDNGSERREFLLDSPQRAVVIPCGLWCTLTHFAPGTVVVVGASEAYTTEGYIRTYEDYLAYIRQ